MTIVIVVKANVFLLNLIICTDVVALLVAPILTRPALVAGLNADQKLNSQLMASLCPFVFVASWRLAAFLPHSTELLVDSITVHPNRRLDRYAYVYATRAALRYLPSERFN